MRHFLKEIRARVILSKKKRSHYSEISFKAQEELKNGIDKLKINGYQLPQSVINRFKNKTWKEPINNENFKKTVIENCPFQEEVKQLNFMIDDFSLFSLELMKCESEYLKHWLDPEWEKDRVLFLGKKDQKNYPGNIEHDKVILFADFGHGSDTCFALDYKDNNMCPSVILLYRGKDPYEETRWKKIATSFEEFEKIIWKGE